MEDKRQNKVTSFQMKVVGLLQKDSAFRILNDVLPQELQNCRVAVCVVFQHLERILTRAVRKVMEIKYNDLKVRRLTDAVQHGTRHD